MCGTENPIGLRLRFQKVEGGAETHVRPRQEFQGFDGVLQGGIVAGLMDDAMWYAIFAMTQTLTMTAELTVRYKAPVPVETDLRVVGRLVEQRRALFATAAEIQDASGKVLAEATGKFLKAPQSVVERLTVVMD